MFLVTGATGGVGRHVVRGLLDGGHEVRALSRNPEQANVPDGVEVVAGDLTQPASLAPALRDAHKVFLMAPGAEPAVFDLIRKAGVRHVVLLSSQAVETHPGNAISLSHARAEEVLRNSGLEWTFLRPGQFASNALMYAKSVREGVVRAPFPHSALPAIHPADIAAVAVAALTHPGHEGQSYPMTGPEAITVRDQVRILSSVLGTEIAYEEVSAERAKAMMGDMPAVIADAVLEVIGDASEREMEVLPTVENVTGEQPRGFEQWVRDNLAAFTG